MLGTVEVIGIEFEGNKFKGEIIPALREVVNQGLIRIIDLVFVKKDSAGKVQIRELKDVEPELMRNVDPMLSDVMGLISEKDIQKVADALDNNSSTGIMVFEHLWSKKFVDAVLRAKGKLIMDVRVPREVVDEAEAASKTLVKA